MWKLGKTREKIELKFGFGEFGKIGVNFANIWSFFVKWVQIEYNLRHFEYVLIIFEH